MKKFCLFTLVVIVVTGSFISCKKGEHDSFLSLRSRNARFEGNWSVVDEVISETNIDGNVTEKIDSRYDGKTNIIVIANTDAGVTITGGDTIKYTTNLVVEKDGTYKLTIANDNKLDITITEGTWIFLGKSKINKLKNKEAVLLTVTKTIISDGSVTNTVDYTGLNGANSNTKSTVLVLDELKNKEMITIVEEDSRNETGLVSTKKTTTTRYTHN